MRSPTIARTGTAWSGWTGHPRTGPPRLGASPLPGEAVALSTASEAARSVCGAHRPGRIPNGGRALQALDHGLDLDRLNGRAHQRGHTPTQNRPTEPSGARPITWRGNGIPRPNILDRSG